MKKEKPILFSGPMVKAILHGRKTQTRRILNPRHWPDDKRVNLSGAVPERRRKYQFLRLANGNEYGGPISCPYGEIGGSLWVRETWAPLDASPTGAYYRADIENPKPGGWKPSIHMPRSACRLVLEVTSIRIERLQDISEEDAKAEGAIKHTLGNGSFQAYPTTPWRAGFARLWDSINAKRGYGWDTNPWVWVVKFEKI